MRSGETGRFIRDVVGSRRHLGDAFPAPESPQNPSDDQTARVPDYIHWASRMSSDESLLPAVGRRPLALRKKHIASSAVRNTRPKKAVALHNTAVATHVHSRNEH